MTQGPLGWRSEGDVPPTNPVQSEGPRAPWRRGWGAWVPSSCSRAEFPPPACQPPSAQSSPGAPLPDQLPFHTGDEPHSGTEGLEGTAHSTRLWETKPLKQAGTPLDSLQWRSVAEGNTRGGRGREPEGCWDSGPGPLHRVPTGEAVQKLVHPSPVIKQCPQAWI